MSLFLFSFLQGEFVIKRRFAFIVIDTIMQTSKYMRRRGVSLLFYSYPLLHRYIQTQNDLTEEHIYEDSF
jgi:hypothetical protein